MSGWIKLHRDLLSWEWYRTPNMVHFWIHCLLRANHLPQKWEGIDVCEGQFISGRLSLSAETGLSEQEIRTCLARLKSTNELTSISTSKYTLFTVISWKKYQIEEPANQQPNQPATSNQPAINQQSTTNKNDKKERKKEEEAQIPSELLLFDGFSDMWESFLENRKKLRKPATEKAKALLLSSLCGIKNPVLSLQRSIENGWSGVFEGKNDPEPYKPTPRRIPQKVNYDT